LRTHFGARISRRRVQCDDVAMMCGSTEQLFNFLRRPRIGSVFARTPFAKAWCEL
jgi:hypothetical protein